MKQYVRKWAQIPCNPFEVTRHTMVRSCTIYRDIQNTQAGHVLEPGKQQEKGRPHPSWQRNVMMISEKSVLHRRTYSQATVGCALWRSCVAQFASSAHGTTNV